MPPPVKWDEVVEVALAAPFGMGIKGSPAHGMFISRVAPGKNAAQSGKVSVGMRLISVNDKSLDGLDKGTVLGRLKAATGVNKFKLFPDPEGWATCQREADMSSKTAVQVLCSYTSPRGQCSRVVEGGAELTLGFALCVLHKCPVPGCKNSKSSRSAACNEHAVDYKSPTSDAQPALAQAHPVKPVKPDVQATPRIEHKSVPVPEQHRAPPTEWQGPWDAWKLINDAPALNRPIRSNTLHNWNHGANLGKVLTAMKTKELMDRQEQQGAVQPDFTVRSLLAGDAPTAPESSGSARTRRRLRQWLLFVIVLGELYRPHLE